MTTPGSRLSIVQHDHGDVVVLTLAGEILLDDGDLALRRCVHDLVARQRPRIVVDLGLVSYIDSAGMGMLVSKRQTAIAAGGDLRLANVTPRNQRALALMKLDKLFATYDSEAEAIASFRQ